MPTASQAIAEWASRLRLADFSESDLKLARRSLADTVGVSFAGRSEEACVLVGRYARQEQPKPDCVVWATGERVSDELAALVNGTMAHVLDFDDVSSPMRGHPSVVLWPAIFAVAERHGMTDAEAQAAYVIGLECVAKIGRLLAVPQVTMGWHSTPVLGVVGAAVACAWLMKLDTRQTAHAIGIAFAQAAGTRANFGTMSKSLHAGLAAAAAIRSVKLAQLGYDAGSGALDGTAGLSRLYADGESFGTVIAELGAPFESRRSGLDVKRYPLCYATHRAIEGVTALRRRHGLDLADVDTVEVIASNRASLALVHDRPTGSLEAKFSMQYAMAATLLDGRIGLDSFSEAMVNRPQIQAFLPRVTSGEDGGAVLPRWARVTLRLRDGKVLTEEVFNLPGSAEDPLSESQLGEKFSDCMAFAGYSGDAGALFKRIVLPAADAVIADLTAILQRQA